MPLSFGSARLNYPLRRVPKGATFRFTTLGALFMCAAKPPPPPPAGVDPSGSLFCRLRGAFFNLKKVLMPPPTPPPLQVHDKFSHIHKTQIGDSLYICRQRVNPKGRHTYKRRLRAERKKRAAFVLRRWRNGSALTTSNLWVRIFTFYIQRRWRAANRLNTAATHDDTKLVLLLSNTKECHFSGVFCRTYAEVRAINHKKEYNFKKRWNPAPI